MHHVSLALITSIASFAAATAVNNNRAEPAKSAPDPVAIKAPADRAGDGSAGEWAAKALADHAAPEAQKPIRGPGYTLDSAGGVGGLWVSRDYKSPFAAIYSDRRLDNAVIGISRDQSGQGFDFAVSADRDGVTLQIRDEKGKLHHLPASALLKLAEPAAGK